MQILYLHQYFNTPQMSGGTRSYEMARRLVSAGHEVHMITSDRDHSAKGDWRVTHEAGIVVHWLSVPYSNRMPYRKRIEAFLWFAFKSGMRSACLPADVIFATSTPLTIVLPAFYAARCQRKPMVFEVRDLWPELPIAVRAIRNPVLIAMAKQLERFAYNNSKAVVALSPGMKEGVVRTGYPRERVHVIPNSCDLELFQAPANSGISFRKKFPWLDDRPLVIYAGTFGRINGVGYLAKLAAETMKLASGVRFLAVGDGAEFELVKNLARDLGVLEKNFFMMSSLPKADMPVLFSAATISTSFFIDLPQMWSNSANKFFDSLAAGRPVAINHEGWQANLLRESGAGLVLPVKDFPEAARLLVSSITDKAWIAKAVKAAQSLAYNRFARDRLAEQLEMILTQAAQK